MYLKCDARRDSKASYLWLRNNIFYYRVELPRVNGKRRYKRVSLHTGNFFEAREKVRIMSNGNNWPFDDIRKLVNGLIFEDYSEQGENVNLVSRFGERRRLSKFNKKKDIEELLLLSSFANNRVEVSLTPEDRKLLDNVAELIPQMLEFLQRQEKSTLTVFAPSHTILEVLNTMLLKGNNCKAEQTRKKNTITKLLNAVELKLEDDYSKFHSMDVVNAISQHIVGLSDIKGDLKRKYIRYIKELAVCGTTIEPDVYKTNVILNLPKIEKTKKSEKRPHLPYTEEQLMEIFNVKHTYFAKHQDAFYVCLVALFTGARANGALTLQYDDVFVKDGVDCIYFRENHPIKQLKNEASERIVPVHPQLLRAGFVDYIRSNQKKLKAKGSDFIFPKCQTRGGKYNNKYTERVLFNYFKDIGVKIGSNDGLDFHSFRKNASIIMQDAGITPSYINDIIGWEGEGTMEQSYSNHTLAQIKEAMSKFEYDYLEADFAHWKKIFKL